MEHKTIVKALQSAKNHALKNPEEILTPVEMEIWNKLSEKLGRKSSNCTDAKEILFCA